jgi:signal transduction histidine kinase/CHASE3 domain sensor protein
MSLNRLRIFFSIIILGFIGLSLGTYKILDGYMKGVSNIRSISYKIDLTQQILSFVKDAETAQRGFQLSDDEEYLLPYDSARIHLPSKLNALDSAASNDPTLTQYAGKLRVLIDRQFEIINQILQSSKRNTRTLQLQELALLANGKQNMDSLRVLAVTMLAYQQAHLLEATEAEGGFRKLTPITFISTALIACLGVFFLFTRALSLIEERDVKSAELSVILNQRKVEIENRIYAENLLRNVLDNSLDGVWAFKSVRDSSGEIEDFTLMVANKASLRLTNHIDEEVVGKNWFSIVSSKKAFLFDEVKRVVETGNTYRTEIEYILHLTNELIWLKLTAVKFVDGFILTFSDVTKEKYAELQTKKYTSELKRSNEDLEQFAFVASHDLQEPLRKIRSFGDRLQTKYSSILDSLGQDYINRMQLAAGRMQVLIEDLLAFSRITRGTDSPEVIDMADLICEVKDDLGDQIMREQAVLEVEEIPSIEGIREQIKRLFQNIISNAIKFRKPDINPLIRISGRLVSRESVISEGLAVNEKVPMYVRIEIADNGIGFDEKYADQIFNVFQRLHGKLDFEGTGIGLAICKKIASNNRGFVFAKSIVGVGSKFIIILPGSSNRI